MVAQFDTRSHALAPQRFLTQVKGGGYFSQSEQLLHFGLGGATRVDRLIVRWPDGAEHILEDLPADQVLKITRDGG
jgi:hypothetical protein